jgi:hypothetical protein
VHFYLIETYRIQNSSFAFHRCEDHVAVFWCRHRAEDFADALCNDGIVPILDVQPVELLRRLQLAEAAGVTGVVIDPHELTSMMVSSFMIRFVSAHDAFSRICEEATHFVEQSLNVMRS